jgi:hypothetical protein
MGLEDDRQTMPDLLWQTSNRVEIKIQTRINIDDAQHPKIHRRSSKWK